MARRCLLYVPPPQVSQIPSILNYLISLYPFIQPWSTPPGSTHAAHMHNPCTPNDQTTYGKHAATLPANTTKERTRQRGLCLPLALPHLVHFEPTTGVPIQVTASFIMILALRITSHLHYITPAVRWPHHHSQHTHASINRPSRYPHIQLITRVYTASYTSTRMHAEGSVVRGQKACINLWRHPAVCHTHTSERAQKMGCQDNQPTTGTGPYTET